VVSGCDGSNYDMGEGDRQEKEMIVPADNRFGISPITHSLGLRNNMTIPNPGFDSNPLLMEEKRWWGRGLQGINFDGSGLFGTGLFSGDWTTWGWEEALFGAIGVYAVYSMIFQAKQTKYRMEIGAGRRRKTRAASLRAKAKQLEEQTTGIF